VRVSPEPALLEVGPLQQEQCAVQVAERQREVGRGQEPLDGTAGTEYGSAAALPFYG
jgi:hypothetical protein